MTCPATPKLLRSEQPSFEPAVYCVPAAFKGEFPAPCDKYLQAGEPTPSNAVKVSPGANTPAPSWTVTGVAPCTVGIGWPVVGFTVTTVTVGFDVIFCK